VVSTTPRPLYPGKHPVHIVQEARWAPGLVWTCAKNLALTGIRSQNRPARSKSLYRMSDPAHVQLCYVCKIQDHLLAQRFYFLINAPTCFGLTCKPSSGGPVVISMCSLCFNLHGRNSTYDKNDFEYEIL
jgi:hypothetical protein